MRMRHQRLLPPPLSRTFWGIRIGGRRGWRRMEGFRSPGAEKDVNPSGGSVPNFMPLGGKNQIVLIGQIVLIVRIA